MSRTSLGLRVLRGCQGAAVAAADSAALLDGTALRAACVLPLRGGSAAGLNASPCGLEAAPRAAPFSLHIRPFSSQPAGSGPKPVSPPSTAGQEQQVQSQAQAQEQPAVRRNESGWDEADEPAPIPLDPNVEPPGMLFVTAGATLSAVLAVSVAALGIIGTFYAGWAISQVAKEMRKHKPAAPGAGGAGSTAKGQAGPAAQPAAGGAATKQATQTGSGGDVNASAGSVPRRTWWGWLGGFFRRRPQGAAGEPSGDDRVPPTAAPA
ncbi:hypothetical protein HYH03_002541 [Edaphochlamys debaryana]|uniref:Uncharacterized protein n=1 Tax=Edaphochlamys debaryana TaxID=47281 RepID=A0A836C487_9CHLO|nr:hypothetical protein HYH03_002541 [Edaphochlamys debaryana]|eukprot:KAG2499600.1 hypothetical protein HYH03_002541 [Edaphochlamys debaryana]